MKFAVLLHQDEQVWADMSPEGRAQYHRDHEAFQAAVAERGAKILGGEVLDSVAAATTVRRRGSEVVVTEGPFAETVEQLGGFYLVDAPDLDVLVDLVRLLPPHTIELRPVVEL